MGGDLFGLAALIAKPQTAMTIFRHTRSGPLVNHREMAFDPVSRQWQLPCPPVAVISTGNPNQAQMTLAEAIGRLLAQHGLTVICGGKSGVMEAACRGVAAVPGGLSISLLPDEDPEVANSFVTVPIATGIGVARDAQIARAACCLVAVGGGYGTLSEIAFALQFGRPALCVGQALDVQGAIDRASTDDVLLGVASAALRL